MIRSRRPSCCVEDGVERLADGRSLDLELGLAVGGGAELRRDLHRDRHRPGIYYARLAASCDRLDAGLERFERRLDLVHREALARRVQRLQALAGDVDDDALVGVDLARLGELREHRDRDAAGGLGEDPGRLGQQADAGADLVVGDRLDRAAGPAGQFERVGAVGGVADREALGDRVRALRAADVLALARTPRRPGCSPSAWAPLKAGSSPSTRPSSSHSLSPWPILVNSEPEAIGQTIRSGSYQPSCSTISKAIVFEPSA